MDYRSRCPVASIINFLVSDTSPSRIRQSAAFYAEKKLVFLIRSCELKTKKKKERKDV